MHVGEWVRFCHHCQEQMFRQGYKPVNGCNSVKHWGAKMQHGSFRHRQPIISFLDACFIKYACALHSCRHFKCAFSTWGKLVVCFRGLETTKVNYLATFLDGKAVIKTGRIVACCTCPINVINLINIQMRTFFQIKRVYITLNCFALHCFVFVALHCFALFYVVTLLCATQWQRG